MRFRRRQLVHEVDQILVSRHRSAFQDFECRSRRRRARPVVQKASERLRDSDPTIAHASTPRDAVSKASGQDVAKASGRQ
jgi:hypothetical protein